MNPGSLIYLHEEDSANVNANNAKVALDIIESDKNYSSSIFNFTRVIRMLNSIGMKSDGKLFCYANKTVKENSTIIKEDFDFYFDAINNPDFAENCYCHTGIYSTYLDFVESNCSSSIKISFSVDSLAWEVLYRDMFKGRAFIGRKFTRIFEENKKVEPEYFMRVETEKENKEKSKFFIDEIKDNIWL